MVGFGRPLTPGLRLRDPGWTFSGWFSSVTLPRWRAEVGAVKYGSYTLARWKMTCTLKVAFGDCSSKGGMRT